MIRFPFFSRSPKAVEPTGVSLPTVAVPSPLDEARYVQSFNDGYALAMGHGLPALQTRLMDQAIEASLSRLEPLVASRVKVAEALNPRGLAEVTQKREEFRAKLASAKTEPEKQKYSHYLDALEWALNVYVHPNADAT